MHKTKKIDKIIPCFGGAEFPTNSPLVGLFEKFPELFEKGWELKFPKSLLSLGLD